MYDPTPFFMANSRSHFKVQNNDYFLFNRLSYWNEWDHLFALGDQPPVSEEIREIPINVPWGLWRKSVQMWGGLAEERVKLCFTGKCEDRWKGHPSRRNRSHVLDDYILQLGDVGSRIWSTSSYWGSCLRLSCKLAKAGGEGAPVPLLELGKWWWSWHVKQGLHIREQRDWVCNIER